mmetsp:Transcript_17165/g.60269  ORF Transcript_17165/g.60269 Transcript_17165/m.60269 type:complete len:213 (-) Transcript_17165:414-1052(-)
MGCRNTSPRRVSSFGSAMGGSRPSGPACGSCTTATFGYRPAQSTALTRCRLSAYALYVPAGLLAWSWYLPPPPARETPKRAPSVRSERPPRGSETKPMPRRLSKNCRRMSEIMLSVLRLRKLSNRNSRSSRPRPRVSRHPLNAFSTVRWSELSSANLRRASSACSRLSSGATNGERKLMAAATVSTGSRQRKMAPKRIILPMRGATGSVARW